MKPQKVFYYLILSLIFNISPAFANDVVETTTIVVIDGKALLVDLDNKGNIVTTYMEVPEYFESTKDHATKVTEAKRNYTKLSKAEMDQIRFIAIADKGWELDEFMISNLADLATHYQQTYANQIEITVAKNKTNEELIENNIDRIKELLLSYGVAEHDLVIKYKIDMGEDPTRFVKVVSNLRSLVNN